MEQPPPPLPGTYRQKSWLPWWLAVVAPIAAAIVAAIILLSPKQTVVPNLTKAKSVFDAQKMLNPLGLKLQPQPALKRSPNATAGSIVAQAPAAGAKVKRGMSVLVTVAIYSAKQSRCQTSSGSTPVTADTTLRAGRADARQRCRRSRQTPTARSHADTRPGTVAAGTPVEVFLKPASRPPLAPAPAPGRQPAAAVTGSAAAKAVAIPAAPPPAARRCGGKALTGRLCADDGQAAQHGSVGALAGTRPPAGQVA